MPQAPTAATDLRLVQVTIDDLHPEPTHPRKDQRRRANAPTRLLRQWLCLSRHRQANDDRTVVAATSGSSLPDARAYETVGRPLPSRASSP